MLLCQKRTISGDYLLYFIINVLCFRCYMVYIFIFLVIILYYFLGYCVNIFYVYYHESI
jgi:hypothetical protein